MGGMEVLRHGNNRRNMAPPTHISIDTKKRSAQLKGNKENSGPYNNGNAKSRAFNLSNITGSGGGKGNGNGKGRKNNNGKSNGNGGSRRSFWRKLTNKKKKKQRQRQAKTSNNNETLGPQPTKGFRRRPSEPQPAPDLTSFLQQDEEDDDVHTLQTTSMTASHGGQSRISLANQSRASSLTTNSHSPSKTSLSQASSKYLEAGYPADGADAYGDANDNDTLTSSLPSNPLLLSPRPVYPRPSTARISSPGGRAKSSHSVSFADDPTGPRTTNSAVSPPSGMATTSPISPPPPQRLPELKRSFVTSRKEKDESMNDDADVVFAVSMQRYHDLFKNQKAPKTRPRTQPTRSNAQSPLTDIDENESVSESNLQADEFKHKSVSDPISATSTSTRTNQASQQLVELSDSLSYSSSLDRSDHAVHLNGDGDSFNEDLLSLDSINEELFFDAKQTHAELEAQVQSSFDSEEESMVIIIENLKDLIANGFQLEEYHPHAHFQGGVTDEKSENLSSVSTVNSLAKHQLLDDSVEKEWKGDDELDIPLTIIMGKDEPTLTSLKKGKDLSHSHDIYGEVGKEMRDKSSSSDEPIVLRDRPTTPSSPIRTTTKTTTTTTTTTTTRKKLEREDSSGWIPNGALANYMADEHSSHTSSSCSSIFSFTSADFAENDLHEREIMQQYSSRSLQITTIVEETAEDGSTVVSRTSTSESVVEKMGIDMDMHDDEEDENEFIDIFLDQLDSEVDATMNEANGSDQDLVTELPCISPSRSDGSGKVANMREMMQKTVSWKEKPKVHLYEPDYEVNIEMALSLVRSYDPRYTNKRVGLNNNMESIIRKPLHSPTKGARPLPSILKRSVSAPPVMVESSDSDSASTPSQDGPTNLYSRSGPMDPMAFKAMSSLPFSNRSLSSNETSSSDDSPVEKDEKYQTNNRSFINLPPSPIVRSSSDPNKSNSMDEFFLSNSAMEPTEGTPHSKAPSNNRNVGLPSTSDISWDPEPTPLRQFPAVRKESSNRSMSTTSSTSRVTKPSTSSLPSTLSYETSLEKLSASNSSPLEARLSDEDESMLSTSTTTSDSVKYMVERLHRESNRRRRKAKSKRTSNNNSNDQATKTCFPMPSCYQFY